MSSQNPESNEESKLQELFDRTGGTLRPDAESRLLARASEIAHAKKPRRRWADPRFVWPGALAAAAAIGFLVVTPSKGPSPMVPVSAPGSESSIAPPSMAVPPTVSADETASNAASDDPESEESEDVTDSDDLALAVLGENGDGFDLGPLMAEDDETGN